MILVSVIITTYNRKYEVAKAIESIKNQTIEPDEIIVVDDGSTDGTCEHITRKYGSLITLIQKEEKVGVAAARNLGLAHARGQYIAFLDSDNEWKPERLSELISCIEENDAPEVVYNLYYQHIKNKRHILSPQKTYDASSVIYKRSLLEQVGLYDDKFSVMCDCELALRIKRVKSVRMFGVEKPLTECWCTYDGLANDIQKKGDERIKVLCKHEEIILQEFGKEYFSEYMNEIPEGTSQYDWCMKFIDASGDSSEWKDTVLGYYADKVDYLNQALYKRNSFYNLLFQWLDKKLDDNTVEKALAGGSIASVAIYGAGKHGLLLYKELKQQNNINVKYFIDKNEIETDIPVYKLEDGLPEVDAVIISPYLETEAIKPKIKAILNCKVISLEQLVRGKVDGK